MSPAANIGKPAILRILFVGAIVACLVFLPLFHNHPLFRSGSNSGNLKANSDFCLFCALGFFVAAAFALLSSAHVIGFLSQPLQAHPAFIRVAVQGTRGPPRL